jgi:hypothetical protein
VHVDHPCPEFPDNQVTGFGFFATDQAGRRLDHGHPGAELAEPLGQLLVDGTSTSTSTSTSTDFGASSVLTAPRLAQNRMPSRRGKTACLSDRRPDGLPCGSQLRSPSSARPSSRPPRSQLGQVLRGGSGHAAVRSAVPLSAACATCLVGIITQCRIDPPRFLVWVSGVNRTFHVVHRAPFLALHLYDECQGDIVSPSGEEARDDVDKFSGLRWHMSPVIVPLLDEPSAWMVVEILDRYGVGDHEGQFTAPVDGGGGNRLGPPPGRPRPSRPATRRTELPDRFKPRAWGIAIPQPRMSGCTRKRGSSWSGSSHC